MMLKLILISAAGTLGLLALLNCGGGNTTAAAPGTSAQVVESDSQFMAVAWNGVVECGLLTEYQTPLDEPQVLNRDYDDRGEHRLGRHRVGDRDGDRGDRPRCTPEREAFVRRQFSEASRRVLDNYAGKAVYFSDRSGQIRTIRMTPEYEAHLRATKERLENDGHSDRPPTRDRVAQENEEGSYEGWTVVPNGRRYPRQ